MGSIVGVLTALTAVSLHEPGIIMDYLDYDPISAIAVLPPHIRKNLSHPLFIAAWIEELGLASEAREKSAELSAELDTAA